MDFIPSLTATAFTGLTGFTLFGPLFGNSFSKALATEKNDPKWRTRSFSLSPTALFAVSLGSNFVQSALHMHVLMAAGMIQGSQLTFYEGEIFTLVSWFVYTVMPLFDEWWWQARPASICALQAVYKLISLSGTTAIYLGWWNA
ncbi:hypothetical protein SeLEV6574_g04975 [Synchytrium endobioticum]|nr:hypothetical protein SeLEV6574_g04975 [Synchytrium endobioticum]